MKTSLSHIKVGDKLVTERKRQGCYNPAPLDYVFWDVLRVTATLIVCKMPGGTAELRVRRQDGKVITKGGTYAVQATPDVVERHQRQHQNHARYSAAVRSLADLIGMQHHELKLSVRQLEHLAKAWAEVKAMR